jgi:hypothetical protein
MLPEMKARTLHEPVARVARFVAGANPSTVLMAVLMAGRKVAKTGPA